MKRSSSNTGKLGEVKEEAAMTGEVPLSRRTAVGRVAFFGAVMSALGSRAFAQPGAPGRYSNSAIAATAAR